MSILRATCVGSLRLPSLPSPIGKGVNTYMWDFDEEDTPSTKLTAEESNKESTTFTFPREGYDFTMDPDYFFSHNQKAGGTTLRNWWKSVCAELKAKGKVESNDCAFIAEGSSITEEDTQTLFGLESTNIVAMINLREPVSRTQSLFNNWGAGKVIDGRMRPTIDEFIAGETPTRPRVVSDQKVIDHNHTSRCGNTPDTGGLNHGCPMCACFDNMYVKSLAGTNPRIRGGENWEETTMDDFNVAKQRLDKFNAVIITEWLDRPEMAEYISKHVLQLDQTIPFKHDNRAGGEYTYFTPQQWADLAERNKFDSMLYAYAKKLVLKRMKDAGFSMLGATA